MMKTILILLVLSLGSCFQKEAEVLTRAQLIENALEGKLDKIRNKKEKTCKKEALEEAMYYVDSLIAKEFSLLMIDTIRFPIRPIRPRLPGGNIKLDTTSITPIIKK